MLSCRSLHRICCAAAVLCSSLAYGQGGSTVSALQQALVGQTLTIKIPGIHSATRGLMRPIDTRIVSGAVQRRGLDILRANDTVLAPGTAVQVVTVEGVSENREDVLRIGANVRGGYASLAFVVSKGTLPSLSTEQVVALLSPVLEGPALVALKTQPAALSTGSVAAVASKPAPPPAPSHPPNTELKFPSAAPGYPALQASSPAPEGCWWAPVLVEQYKLEMLVRRCEPGSSQYGANFEYTPDGEGVGMAEPGKPVSHIFDVLTKPADQTIVAAIRQQYISKLKSPAARTSCVAQRKSGEVGPVETYEAHATGAYARQARFNRKDDSADDPCPGLASNDAVTMFVQYTPDNSKTHFLYFQYQDEIPVDPASVRFMEGTDGSHLEMARAGASPTNAVQQASLARSPAASGGAPQPGVWSYTKAATHAAAQSAATLAKLSVAFDGGVPHPTPLLLACNEAAPGGPQLEFRAIFPSNLIPPPAFLTGRGRLVLPGISRQYPVSSVRVGNDVALLVSLTAADGAVMAADGSAVPDGIFLSFNVGSVFKADLPARNAALDAVLTACHVRPEPSTAALAPDRVTHLELAKVALGMNAAQVRQALGGAYQYVPQTDARFPRLSFLTAWGSDSSYAVTFIDGTAAGFTYTHAYPPGARPLETNVIDGISTKTWQPILVRPGFEAMWVADSAGRPQLRRGMDNNVHPCAYVPTVPPAPVPPGYPNGRPPFPSPDKVAPANYPAECGVTIELKLNRPSPNNGEDESFSAMVANKAVLNQFMQTVNAAAQQQRKAEHDKLNSVPTTF